MFVLVPALIIPFLQAGASSTSMTVEAGATAGQLSVRGHDFPRQEWILLAWNGSAQGMPVPRSDRYGRFQVTVVIPAGTPAGDHTLSASLAPSGWKAGKTQRASSTGASSLASIVVTVASDVPSPTTPAAATSAPTAPPDRTAPPTERPTGPPATAPPTSEPANPPPAPDPTPRPTPAPDPTSPPEPAINVRDYGARGDGSTNDTAAFNAAQTAAKAASGIVFVPDGTYALNRFFPKSGITLKGESRANTILIRTGPGVHAAGGFIHIEGVANVVIKNLTIRGTGRRLSDTGQTGRGDDILIDVINGRNVTVRNVSLVNAQGCGIQTEGAETYNGLFENISITNTFVRDNGYHGVALWPYNGTHDNVFRGITIDGADYAGIMIDAGTTVGPAAGVNNNVFEDIVIRNAARYHILNGGTGAGWMFTGGRGNRISGYEITDVKHGAALAFGADQSGIGSTDNTLISGHVARVTSGIVAAFGGGARDNVFNGGSGGGLLTGSFSLNTFLNWPGLTH